MCQRPSLGELVRRGMYSGLIRMAILIQEITTFAEIHLIMQVVLGATQPILKEDGKIANQVTVNSEPSTRYILLYPL